MKNIRSVLIILFTLQITFYIALVLYIIILLLHFFVCYFVCFLLVAVCLMYKKDAVTWQGRKQFKEPFNYFCQFFVSTHSLQWCPELMACVLWLYFPVTLWLPTYHYMKLWSCLFIYVLIMGSTTFIKRKQLIWLTFVVIHAGMHTLYCMFSFVIFIVCACLIC